MSVCRLVCIRNVCPFLFDANEYEITNYTHLRFVREIISNKLIDIVYTKSTCEKTTNAAAHRQSEKVLKSRAEMILNKLFYERHKLKSWCVCVSADVLRSGSTTKTTNGNVRIDHDGRGNGKGRAHTK